MLDRALARAPDRARGAARRDLTSPEQAQARAIAGAALRRLGQIDALLDEGLRKPLAPGAGRARAILRSGAAEILFLQSGVHAAVDLSVEAARMNQASRGFAGLINALLRRIAAQGSRDLARFPAGRWTTPGWLWRRWQKTYGPLAQDIAEAHLAPPPLDLRVQPGAPPPPGAQALAGGGFRLAAAGRIEQIAGFGEGRWWVQDWAAGLPARLFGALRGRRVLDMCAAPGGKCAQMIAAGAQVVALERDPARMGRLRENLARLGMRAECRLCDAAAFRPAQRFSHILLDAPCLGTGTIRRRPDLPHLKRRGELKVLTRLQKNLLAAAVRLLAPGGVLVYCVCSLEPEEGEEQINAFLQNHDFMARSEPEHCGAPERELLTPAGDLRSLPCHYAAQGGMDGFYAARLIRTAG